MSAENTSTSTWTGPPKERELMLFAALLSCSPKVPDWKAVAEMLPEDVLPTALSKRFSRFKLTFEEKLNITRPSAVQSSPKTPATKSKVNQRKSNTSKKLVTKPAAKKRKVEEEAGDEDEEEELADEEEEHNDMQ